MIKILISGEGGQGVRVISHTLATLLANFGYEVSLLYDYDATVRGGMSKAHLIFDKKPIVNPVIDEADILLKLSDKAKGLHAKRIVCATGVDSDSEDATCEYKEEIPFHTLGIERFGREIFGNMIALGHLMALVGIDVTDKKLAETLPLRHREENLSAVLFGYHLKEDDLERGRHSKKRDELDLSSDQPDETAPEEPQTT